MSEITINIYKTIEAINLTVDLFYQQNKEEGLILLNNVFEELIYLVDVYFNFESAEYNEDLKTQFNQLLTKAMHTLEDNDMVLLADILNFEIKEFLLSHNTCL